MADFITAETSVIVQSGSTPNTLVVNGTYTNSAGGTGGLILPGYTTSGGTTTANGDTVSIGGRNIISVTITPGTEDVTTPKVAVAYNATYDADAVTLTTVANATGFYTIVAQNNGA